MAVAELAALIRERQTVASRERGEEQPAAGDRITVMIEPPRRHARSAPAAHVGCSPPPSTSSAADAPSEDRSPVQEGIAAAEAKGSSPTPSGYFALARSATPRRLISSFGTSYKTVEHASCGESPSLDEPCESPVPAAESPGVLLSWVKCAGTMPYYSSVRVVQIATSPLYYFAGIQWLKA